MVLYPCRQEVRLSPNMLYSDLRYNDLFDVYNQYQSVFGLLGLKQIVLKNIDIYPDIDPRKQAETHWDYSLLGRSKTFY